MKQNFKIALIFSSLLLVNGHASAQVTTISSENLIQIDKDAYWSADVTCQDNGIHAIHRKADEDQWCAKEVVGFCQETKSDAAKTVCGNDFKSAIALVEATKKAQQKAVSAKLKAENEKADLAAKAEKQRIADNRLKQQQQAQLKNEKKIIEAAPIKQQISIEQKLRLIEKEKLILIEQEKLNLRLQELELQKRAVEIEKQIQKTDG